MAATTLPAGTTDAGLRPDQNETTPRGVRWWREL
ncbi:sugar ABC transporter permease, partial [Cellulomonas septica]|nr:sugar ABC transporter permease [Cellulomonas septica]